MAERNGPLHGIRVIDCSIALTGPYAVALLADQGADVVKVERPGFGDIARYVGVSVNGTSALYTMCNRGKRSIAIDITKPEGRDVVVKLAEGADVFIENFRPGVLDRAGLGYDALAAANPDARVRVAHRLRARRAVRDEERVRHRDPGVRRVRREPGRPRHRRAPVPQPDRGRQGHRHVRRTGRHRRAARARAWRRRPARRAVDARCRRVLPVGRRGRQRGAARLRPQHEVELLVELPPVRVHRRLRRRHAHLRRRLLRHVPRLRRRGLRRPRVSRRSSSGRRTATSCR